MNEPQRRFVQGVIVGGFIGAGVAVLMFWRVITSATNAGAMVDGQFQPYSADPSWHILLGGALILVAVSVGFLVVTWRSLGKPHS